MSPYEQFLHLAFATPAEAAQYLTPTARRAHAQFLAAAPPDQPFRFEQLRLGLAMGLLKLLADLGDHEESRRAQEVLHKALEQSRSPKDIDRIVGREAQLFDALYTNLYVNDEGEELLNLFGRTLEADAPELLDEIAQEGVELARTLDFNTDEDEE